jgi:hypothetical protein
MSDLASLQKLLFRSEIKQTSTHTYYNISIYNPTKLYKPAVFYETRNEPILHNPSEHYMSVVRVDCPTIAIPIFIYPGDWKQSGNIFTPTNETKSGVTYAVTLKYGATEARKTVTYQSTTPNFVPYGAIDEFYYYVYSYQQWIDMINASILSAFNTLSSSLPTVGTCFSYKIINGGSGYTGATTITISAPAAGVTATATPIISGGVITGLTFTNAGSGYTDAKAPTATIADGGGGSGAIIQIIAAPVWVPPFIKYNGSESGTCSFVAQTAYDSTIANPIQLFFSTDLFVFFEGSTQHYYYGNPTTLNDKDQQIAFQKKYNNNYDYTSISAPPYLPDGWNPAFAGGTGVFSTKGFEMKQEFNSLFTWNDLQTIVLQSGCVPIKNEYAPTNMNQQSGGRGGDMLPIMTDFQPIIQSGFDARTSLQYTPPGEYRLIDMVSNAPLLNFDVNVSWQEINGTYHPLFLPPQSTMTIKILFRKKNFNNQPATQYLENIATR